MNCSDLEILSQSSTLSSKMDQNGNLRCLGVCKMEVKRCPSASGSVENSFSRIHCLRWRGVGEKRLAHSHGMGISAESCLSVKRGIIGGSYCRIALGRRVLSIQFYILSLVGITHWLVSHTMLVVVNSVAELKRFSSFRMK